MEKRALIAIVLSFLVLYVFQTYFLPKPPEENGNPVTTSVNDTDKLTNVAKKPVKKESYNIKKNLVKIVNKNSESYSDKITAPVKGEITLENSLFKGNLVTPGGGLREFLLKKYKETIKEDSKNVFLVGKEGSYYWEIVVNGQKFDALPFTMNTNNTDEITLKSSNDIFDIENRIQYSSDKYNFQSKFNYSNNLSKAVDLQIFLVLKKLVPVNAESTRYAFEGSMVDVDGSIKKFSLKDFKKDKEAIYSGNINWAGFTDQYFLTAVIFPSTIKPVIKLSEVNDRLLKMRVNIFNKPIDAGQKVAVNLQYFLGPKKLSILKDVNNELSKAVDFGWSGIVAKPILALMNLFNILFHNYGWSIIFMTILIKLLFYPLTYKGFSSMAKLKDVQPLMEDIKKRYADDKEKMNKEIMELYKKNKVNPMGGCLPTLVQIPIFIALYYVLLKAIELRQAPFIWWINDLSAAEVLFYLKLGASSFPVRILPVIMGISMYAQQKLTPTATDKNQQMLFAMLPVVFTFLFYSLPSGLMVYWFTNNLVTIIQQLMINKSLEKKKMANGSAKIVKKGKK